MKKVYPFVCSMFLIMFFYGCRKSELVSHYERPDWLKGNAWELLSSRPDQQLFLSAVEKTDMKGVLIGNGISTVLAPTDDAFRNYLNKKGYAGLDQVPLNELKKVVNYHIVYYAFDKLKFTNYQPQGVDKVEPLRAGLYYKHRTRSKDEISTLPDPVTGATRKIFHKDRFLPVFSNMHFSTKGIDAKSNYAYFYPESTWNDGGFNMSNARVQEYAIPTDNGYVYILDDVIEPLETLHTVLEKQTDYADFLHTYDRFRTLWYDAEATKNYAAAGDSLFIVKHGTLPHISSEWSYNGEGGIADYANLGELAYTAFNVFAPKNDALQSFFNSYWRNYYTDLKSVNFMPLALLMANHVYQENIVFPQEITGSKQLKSTFGSVIKFDPNQDVVSKGIASNGVYYGLNKVIVPDMFYSVTGPALQNPKYKIFLQMLVNTGLITTLMSRDLNYTLFIPSDEVILNTLYGDSYIFWNEGNPLVFGDEVVEVENTEGVKVAMSRQAQELFISNHIVSNNITQIAGKQVFRTRNPFSYVYVKNEGVSSSNAYNMNTNIKATKIAGSWFNGSAYEVETALLKETGTIKFTLSGATAAGNTLNEFSEFSKLLVQAGLMETGSQLSFMFGNNFVLFAPDNAAVLAGISSGKIPTVKADLAEYLKYYFVSVPDNSLSDYPFPGFHVEGSWITAKRNGQTFRTLTVKDSGTALNLTAYNGETATVTSEFPKIFSDGAVYRINKVFTK